MRDEKRFGGSEVYGKTLGLVGVGEISRRVDREVTKVLRGQPSLCVVG